MAEAVANGAASTLNGAILAGATSLTIQTGQVGQFPASGTFRVAVSDGMNTELMTVTAGQGTATWTVTRASEPYAGLQTSFGFAGGSTVAQVLTSAGLTALIGTGGGAGGAGGALVAIQTLTPTGTGTASFAVPTGYRNLKLTGLLRGDNASNNVSGNLTFNSDTTANYDWVQIETVNATNATGTGSAGATSIRVANIASASSVANTPTALLVDIPDYANTTFVKGVHARAGVKNANANASIVFDAYEAWWRSTSAITSITLTLAAGNFVAGSTLTLWGEADTAPVLLTSNSNLIQETILSAAAASISVPNIPQGYRDLRILINSQGTASATAVNLLGQVNGDATAGNYESATWKTSSTTVDVEQLSSATTGVFGRITAATSPAGSPSVVEIKFPNYSGTVLNKSWQAISTLEAAATTGSFFMNHTGGRWKSTAAITAMTFSLSSGNFDTGTTIRVYGEPASMGGASVGTGTRLRLSGNQSITTATATAITWDTEDQDADNQHYTSAANLTGTVAKTAASNALVGTGTAFTTELSIGQVISVPGTAAEVAVVIAITDATHLTVAGAGFANTASGQTATRVNSAVVFRQPGMFQVELGAYLAAVASGTVTVQIRLNGATMIGQADKAGVNASAGYDLVVNRPFQQWDYVEAIVTQGSGGSVNLLADERTHLSINARPTVIVAVPYANIQDQKTQNTDGGAFTAGTWQTRTLNTSSDSSGIAPLVANQITLQPGTYRFKASCPAYAVARHQCRLQNITDGTTLLIGTSTYAAVTNGEATPRSELAGRPLAFSGTKVIELQHQCQTTKTINGFGLAANFGTEVYSILEIWKEG